MCDLDLESCTVYDETIIKAARKDHTCDCCGGPIPKGAEYLKHFSVYDGSATAEKQCSACTAMVKEFTEVHGQHTNPSYMPDLLHECIESERGEGPEGEAMAEKWRTHLRAMHARRGETYEEDKDDDDEADDEAQGEGKEEAGRGDDHDQQGGGN